MSFIPISILAYALEGGAIIVDKVLLNKSLPNPLIYTFYISILSLLVIFLLPFGIEFNLNTIVLGGVSGICFTLALVTFFQSLRRSQASVVGPVVGATNPLFIFILGSIFFQQILSSTQLIAFFILLVGAAILTFNMWFSKLGFDKALLLMTTSGLLFAISYIFLREVFLASNFLTGLVISRLAGGIVALSFLLFPTIRRQILTSKVTQNLFFNKTSILLILGQSMGALSGLLLSAATSLASPALVNALFGIQYVIILPAALILGKNHPKLLDEKLTKAAIFQKILGATILSLGVYLLTR